MAKYKIKIKKTALKAIRKIPTKDIKSILRIINGLSINPRPYGVQKLNNQERYRVRSGNYRILYQIEDNVLTVMVVNVGHRRDVYRS